MTHQQALATLDQAASRAALARHEHALVQQAAQVVAKTIEDLEAQVKTLEAKKPAKG